MLNPAIDTTSQRLALRHSTLLSRRLELAGPIQESTMSIPPSPTDSDAEQDLKTGLKIGVVIHRAESGFALRVNTIHNFLEINRRVGSSSHTYRSSSSRVITRLSTGSPMYSHPILKIVP